VALGLACAAGPAPGAASEPPGRNEQVLLAAQGRYEQLIERLERWKPAEELRTPELHALCFAYSRVKRYKPLLECLGRLEENVRKGDRRTRLFALDDVTPAIHLMRADAMLDVRNYALAESEAQRTLDWQARAGGDTLDMRIAALAVLGLSHALRQDVSRAEHYAKALDAITANWIFDGNHACVRSLSIARVRFALRQYPAAARALESDSRCGAARMADAVFATTQSSGGGRWLYTDLPRGFMAFKLHGEMGRLAQARAGFDRLIALPQARENGDIWWALNFERGRIAEGEGQLEAAARFLATAVDAIEAQRVNIDVAAAEIGFVGDRQAVYARLVEILVRLRRDEEALAYEQRRKAQAIVDHRGDRP